MRVKDTTSDRIYLAIVHVILALLSLMCILPVLHVISESFSSASAILRQKVYFWPVQFSLDSYKLMLRSSRVISAFVNSCIISVVGVALHLFGTTLASYPLSKKYFYGRRFFSILFVFARIFGGNLKQPYDRFGEDADLEDLVAIWDAGRFDMLYMSIFGKERPEIYIPERFR